MEKRLALCIGNNKYKCISPLTCAINDADQMGKVLRRLGYETTIEHDLNRADLISCVFRFVERMADYDACVFYYAGHGFEIKSQNILIPVDFEYDLYAKEEELILNAFPLDRLLEEYNHFPDKVKIIILDACRNTGRMRGITGGFSPVVAPKGSLIAFATSPGEAAFEMAEENRKHGRYTDTLLRFIDADVGVEDIFKRVRQVMDRESNGRQIPWEHTSLTGHFTFGYNHRKAVCINFVDSLRVITSEKKETLYLGLRSEPRIIEINYPVLETNNPHVSSRTYAVEKIQEIISSIYDDMCLAWKRFFTSLEDKNNASDIEMDSEEPFRDGIGFKVLLNQNGVFCICISRYLYTGGCHGLPSRVVKVFDLSSGDEISLATMMNRPVSDIMAMIRDRFEFEKKLHQTKRPIISPSFTLDNYKSVDDFKWYVSEKGIFIYFDIYEASSYSEGFIEFQLTDEAFYKDPLEGMQRLDLGFRIRKRVIEDIAANYQLTYNIIRNQVIGNTDYEIMASSYSPARQSTFWIIRCWKYVEYEHVALEETVHELVSKKKNYEVLTGKSIIAILRVVWDEELKSETVEKCEQEFGGILEEYYDIEGVLYEYQFTSDLLTNENSAIEFH